MIGVMLLALVGQSAAVSQPPFEPAGKWVVGYEDGMCLLSRPYATGAENTEVGFRPMATQDKMQLVVIRAGRAKPSKGEAAVEFDEDLSVHGTLTETTLADGRHRVSSIYVDDDLLRRLPTAKTLTIVTGSDRLVLRVRSGGAALTALDACQDQLFRKWGLDPVVMRSAGKPKLVVDTPARWFGSEAYPAEALRANQQGRVVAVLTIDPGGHPIKCNIAESAGTSLNEATCRVAMRYGRFTPARDGQGQPVAGAFVLPVRWSLP